MDFWIVSILLLGLGIGLIFLELFVPSGGVIGVLAACSLIAAVVLAYIGGGMLFGTIILSVTAIALPVSIVGAIRLWPKTPMGRAILGKPRSSEDVLPNGETYTVLKTLKGRRGKAKTAMLPSGIVVIDKREHDAVSVGMPIERGQAVQVVAIETNHIVVRPANDDEPIDAAQPEQDVLARPIDSLGLDPFEDPLA